MLLITPNEVHMDTKIRKTTYHDLLLGLDPITAVTSQSLLARNTIMTTFDKKLQDCIYHRQKPTNDGVPAGSADSSEYCLVIVYAVM